MTITLHCTHCNQSMAIAPRKPGSRVDCPSCGRGVVVPSADAPDKPVSPVPAREAAVAGRVAESPRAGADRASTTVTAMPRAQTATVPTVSSAATATPSAATGPRTQIPKPALAEPEVPLLPQRIVESPSIRSAELPARTPVAEGVVLPKSVLILLIVFALVSLGIAFFAGLLFGKQSVTQSREAAAVDAISHSVGFPLIDFS